MGAATGTHLVFFDDDDWPYPHYISDIMNAIESDPDCVGQVIDMTYDGQPNVQCVHSLRFKTWSERPVNTPGYGRVFLRNVTHRNPVRTYIAKAVGFPDLRFGEDKVYSDGVTALCKTEVMVERPGFVYRYSTAEPHAQKYWDTMMDWFEHFMMDWFVPAVLIMDGLVIVGLVVVLIVMVISYLVEEIRYRNH